MATSPALRLGVPAYFYPGPHWLEVVAAGEALRALVVNPADGPGARVDPAYEEVVAAASAAGVALLGYVSTSWGARPAEGVLADVRRFRDLYGVTGVFLDETASAGDRLEHYERLVDAVRDGGGPVVLNPGTVPDERYAALADGLVVFEGCLESYRAWAPPAWAAHHPTDRFWHLVHGVAGADLAEVLRLAERRSAGVVYVTDGVMPNPWDRLPTYWSRELHAVRVSSRGAEVGDA